MNKFYLCLLIVDETCSVHESCNADDDMILSFCFSCMFILWTFELKAKKKEEKFETKALNGKKQKSCTLYVSNEFVVYNLNSFFFFFFRKRRMTTFSSERFRWSTGYKLYHGIDKKQQQQ